MTVIPYEELTPEMNAKFAEEQKILMEEVNQELADMRKDYSDDNAYARAAMEHINKRLNPSFNLDGKWHDISWDASRDNVDELTNWLNEEAIVKEEA